MLPDPRPVAARSQPRATPRHALSYQVSCPGTTAPRTCASDHAAATEICGGVYPSHSLSFFHHVARTQHLDIRVRSFPPLHQGLADQLYSTKCPPHGRHSRHGNRKNAVRMRGTRRVSRVSKRARRGAAASTETSGQHRALLLQCCSCNSPC